jgi:AraC-like DNA-binding protein
MKAEIVPSPVVVFTDYTEPADESSDILNRYTYEVRGVDDLPQQNRFFRVKTGLALFVSNSGCSKLSHVAYETLNAPVSFYYVLSGQAFLSVRGITRGIPGEIRFNAGSCIMSSMPRTSGHFSISPRKALTVVELKMDRNLLHTYIQDRINTVPREVVDLLTPDKQVSVTTPLSRQITDLLVQIVRPPTYSAGVMPLFFESRALELLALQLESFCRNEPAGKEFVLNTADIERIYAARETLLSQFHDPPTIPTLARACGINEFKLKKGFKQTFGTTIFGFIKQHKMKAAWQLLEDGQLSVTQTALEVGYSNVSHFIAAFRRQFSINPGQLKRAGK